MFNKVGAYEKRTGLQFEYCDNVKRDEIICDIIENEYRKTRERYGILYYFLMEYIKWLAVEKNQMANQWGVRKNGRYVDLFKTRYFYDDKALSKSIKLLFGDFEEKSVNQIHMAAIWLIYAGVKKKDLEKITTSDVDLDNKLVFVNGCAYKIHDRAVEAISSLIKNDVLLINRTDHYTKVIRCEGNQLLRRDKPYDFDTTLEALKTYAGRIRRNGVDEYNDSYVFPTYDSIRESGLFYNIYKEELLGIQPGRLSFVLDGAGSGRDLGRIEYKSLKLIAKYYLWKITFVL